MTSTFEVIHQNQTGVACLITIILSLVTAVVGGFLQSEIHPAENYITYLAYKIGFQDAALKSGVKNIEEVAMSVTTLDKITTTLRISCGLSFVSSFLHLSSSAWALFKRTPMSNTVWLVTQFIAVITLLIAAGLPLSYPLKGPLVLNLFYSITFVDAFLTALLLIAAYIDQRRSPLVEAIEPDVEAAQASDSPSPTEESPSKSTTTTTANGTNTGDEELPPPPPPPTTATASST